MFVIGDVHGCFETLKALINKLPKDAEICFVGDLIDRGPKSKDVVEFVINNNYNCVKGNHEEMLINEAFPIIKLMQTNEESELNFSSIWYQNGGRQTLQSYRDSTDDFDTETFKRHIKWMSELPTVLVKEFDGHRPLLVSHSIAHNVINNTHMTEKQKENTILWTRNFHNMKDSGYYNIIGHTPLDDGPKIKNIYANIDTGCFVGLNSWSRWKTPKNGVLTAIKYPEKTIIQQELLDEDYRYLPFGCD